MVDDEAAQKSLEAERWRLHQEREQLERERVELESAREHHEWDPNEHSIGENVKQAGKEYTLMKNEFKEGLREMFTVRPDTASYTVRDNRESDEKRSGFFTRIRNMLKR